MPAPYLVKRAYIHGVPFYVDERVIIPRSYIGELMFSGVFGGEDASLIEDVSQVTSVLDLCTGSGCLAIIAAGIFPDADIDAADLSDDALDVARINVADHGFASRINLLQGNLFEAVEGRTYDLIITNPPYVAGGEVAAFPPEYGHEPIMAHIGGEDGLDLVRRILDEAADHLNPGGGLLCEIGTGRELLVAEYPAPRLPLARHRGEPGRSVLDHPRAIAGRVTDKTYLRRPVAVTRLSYMRRVIRAMSGISG